MNSRSTSDHPLQSAANTTIAVEPRGEQRRQGATTVPKDEITLSWLISTFRGGIWLLLTIVAFSTLSMTLIQRMRVPVYTANMIVAPAEHDLGAAGRLVSDIEQHARFATLARVPTRVTQPSVFEEYLQGFRSQRVAQHVATQNNVLQRLFPAEWDAELESWRAPPGMLAVGQRSIMGFFGYPSWSAPGPERVAEFLRRRSSSDPYLKRISVPSDLRTVIAPLLSNSSVFFIEPPTKR